MPIQRLVFVLVKKFRDKLLNDLVDIQFERNDIDFQRGKFRVRGDVVEIFPASRDEHAFRVEFFGDEIDRICEIESLTGRNLGEVEHLVLSRRLTL